MGRDHEVTAAGNSRTGSAWVGKGLRPEDDGLTMQRRLRAEWAGNVVTPSSPNGTA